MTNTTTPDPALPSFTEWDDLADFERRSVTLLGQTKLVFVAGSGPAVIVMSEMPGIYSLVARFARKVRDAGFTVWMPQLFGQPGHPPTMPYAIGSMIRGCISREFRAFAANASSPVTEWLRALAAHAHPLSGGKGVGAIGMCFTGNFALSMMLEPAMLAPVLVLTPFAGASVIVKAFAIVIIGGFGNVEGTILAGLLVGLIESFTTQYLYPGLIDIVVFGLLLVMLTFRPTGLISERREENV